MQLFGKMIVAIATMGVVGIGSAQAALISDFNTTTSPSAFTKATILDQDATKESSLSAPAGTLFATKGTTGVSGNAEQTAYTQAYTINVGDMLRVDYVYGGTSTTYADFGIFIGAQPTDLTYTSGTVSTRSNYVAVYGNNSQGLAKTIAFDGTTQLTSLSVTPTGGLAGVTGLYISHPTATTYVVGYTIGSTDTVIATQTVSAGNAALFNQVGIYTDMRAAGTTAASLDNLQAVPEPASLALLGLGGLACLRRRRA